MGSEAGRHGRGADERGEGRLEIGGNGRLMEARGGGHGSGRLALHVRTRGGQCLCKISYRATRGYNPGQPSCSVAGSSRQAFAGGGHGPVKWVAASGGPLGGPVGASVDSLALWGNHRRPWSASLGCLLTLTSSTRGFPFGEFISDVPHFLQNVTIFFSPSLHDMGDQEPPFPTSLCE
jgi:hypothetical protein